MEDTRTSTDRRSMLRRVLAVVVVAAAAIAQVLIGWLSLTSGLVAPLWAVGVFVLLWLAAVALFTRTAPRRPFVTPVIPLANGLLWWGALLAGGTWLGWSA